MPPSAPHTGAETQFDLSTRAATPGHAGTPGGDTTPGSGARVLYEESIISEGPGSRIGPYMLVELLGEGGFGRVFLADQSEPVRRQVALKIIKLGMDTRQFIARFETERLALALMDHPGIARVLDAGATETGRPYFVMELVRGEPITHYCDTQRLTVRDRLRLFIHVCQAVQHAHQKGIIHRDLKPRNILASRVDDRHVAKVIDFGIAKAVDPGADGSGVTEVRQIIGTPQYMSPEQESAQADIDTRSDVYSLGVLLYELLSGVLPQSVTGADVTLPSGPSSLRGEPTRPSTRMSRLAETPAAGAIAASRRTDAQSLARVLRGDLDWIVMKALERDRTRRYETANGLAADVQRHLANEPVLAGPPSRGYRFRKLVRRHRAAFAMCATIMLAVVLGLIVALHGLVEARTARIEMAAQRDRAQVEADKAAQTAKFAQAMLSGIAPSTARGEDTRLLRKILDESAERVDTELASQPEVQASIHYTIGTAYCRIAQYEPAGKHLRAAEALQLRILGPDDRQTLKTRAELANLLLAQGEHARSEAAYRSVLEHGTRLFGQADSDVIKAMRDLALAVFRQGRYVEAESLSREALRRATQVMSNDDELVLTCTADLSIALGYLSRIEEAETLTRGVLERRRRLRGADHPSCFPIMANLAYLEQVKGDHDAARLLYHEVVERITRSNGARHPETLKARNNLAAFLLNIGEVEDSIAMHREILAARRDVLGNDHPETIYSAANLGEALRKAGELDEARTLLRQALADRERTLGPEHGDTMVSVGSLANFLNSDRQYAEAARLFERKAKHARTRYPPDNDTPAIAYYNWAACLQNGGDDAAAEPVYRETLSMIESIRDPEKQPFVAAVWNGLAKCVQRRGALEESEPLFRKGLQIRRKLYGDKHAQTAFSQIDFANMLIEWRHYDEARELLSPVTEFLTESGQTGSLSQALVLGLVGDCESGAGNFAAAQTALRESRKLFSANANKSTWRDKDPDLRSIRRLVTLYENWATQEPEGGHEKEAARWRKRLTAASQPAADDS